jgi:hypothetical protein
VQAFVGDGCHPTVGKIVIRIGGIDRCLKLQSVVTAA